MSAPAAPAEPLAAAPAALITPAPETGVAPAAPRRAGPGRAAAGRWVAWLPALAIAAVLCWVAFLAKGGLLFPRYWTDSSYRR